MEQQEYKFPDEIENETVIESKGNPVEEDEIQVEVEDDTPPQDRGRTPSQPEFVEQLDKDELDEYSEAAKQKIAGFRKVFHDERRAKEAADRERQEALDLAKKLLEENRTLKGKVTSSEQLALDSYMTSADREMEMAKKEYREAYDAGDSEKLVNAQEKMTAAKIKADRAMSISEQRALQREEPDVQIRRIESLLARKGFGYSTISRVMRELDLLS
jgi:DNA-binding helix-hairpin-helix protein with protein kinase domain